MSISLIIILAVLALGCLWGIGVYNGLVSLRNEVKSAFANIDTKLQRRYDLIPNLVNVAKRYMQHERETLEAVINARNAASQASQKLAGDPANTEAMGRLLKAEGQLGSTLGRLFAVSEAYPDLKADTHMQELMRELSGTEDGIALSRQAYNDVVMRYNIKCEAFPSCMLAALFHFQKADLFEVEHEEVRKAPKVEF